MWWIENLRENETSKNLRAGCKIRKISHGCWYMVIILAILKSVIIVGLSIRKCDFLALHTSYWCESCSAFLRFLLKVITMWNPTRSKAASKVRDTRFSFTKLLEILDRSWKSHWSLKSKPIPQLLPEPLFKIFFRLKTSSQFGSEGNCSWHKTSASQFCYLTTQLLYRSNHNEMLTAKQGPFVYLVSQMEAGACLSCNCCQVKALLLSDRFPVQFQCSWEKL